MPQITDQMTDQATGQMTGQTTDRATERKSDRSGSQPVNEPGAVSSGNATSQGRTISFIVALTRDLVIGRDQSLPWKIPADMGFFVRTTTGKPIIMGRRNHESIGRPLPKRTNIILTRDPDYTAEGCLVAHSAGQALELAGDAPEVMVIGGADIYRLFLPLVNRLYLTWVEAPIPGDTHFPALDWEQWQVTEEWTMAPGDKTDYPLTFQVLDRKPTPDGASVRG